MAVLEWDKAGERTFESGLERGVLYLPDGSAVPWNGLTSIVEKTENKANPIYFDGVKVSDRVTPGDFAATLSAITYPDEFLELEGLGILTTGVFIGDQHLHTFGLSYRTQIGNDTEGEGIGYKLHVLYNITAVASDKNYSSLTDTPTFTEFEWELTAVPEEVPGLRPSAHLVIDSRNVDPDLLAEVELLLYGTDLIDPTLVPFAELMELVLSYFRVEIIDNKDGTWTAITDFPGYLTMVSSTEFRLDNVNAVYIRPDTYKLSDTRY